MAAHALRFEHPARDTYDDAAGRRLLVVFVIVGLVLQPGLKAIARAVGLGGQRWMPLLIIIVLLAAVILGVRLFARARLGAIGLHRWAEWTPREKLYLSTVAPLAAVAFSVVFRDQLARLVAVHGWSGFLLLTLPTGLLWGVIQEILYRGLLQTELVRRYGAIAGVLVANLVFCFGPLHFYHLRLGTGEAPRWGMFAAIFGIGLFFGILYRRSGNLWLPAIFHGMWPPNLS